MELRNYISLIRKRIWLIVLCTLAAGMGGLIASLLSTPIYEATSILRVGSTGLQNTSNYNDLLASQRIAKTYAELLSKAPVLEGVVIDLGLNTTVKDLGKAIKVQAMQDTALIRITARGPDPRTVQSVANAIPRVFVAQEQALEASRYAQLRANLADKIADKKAEIRELQVEIASRKIEDDDLNDPDLIGLESDREQALIDYTTLLQRYANVELAEVQMSNGVAVAVQAGLPSAPASPKTVQNTLLATALGAVTGLGMAFLIEYLDDTIRTADDVQIVLNTPLLSMVPRSREKGKAILIDPEIPLSPLAETYRVLRTNLSFSDVDHPLESIMVTSAGPSEGKSTIIANLGTVMAQAGQKIIIVDADLRRPTQHKLFGLSNATGLTSILADEDLDHSEYLYDTHVPNLRLVPSGQLPPNPSELLGSQRMHHLMSRLQEMADVVLYDTPPVLGLADAAVLAGQIMGTVLIVNSGETRISHARQALSNLEKVGANVVGALLNRANTTGEAYYTYYSIYHEDNVRESAPPNRGPLRMLARLRAKTKR